MLDKINSDLKAAMLAGEKIKVEVLRGLKTALQYEAVSANTENRTLSEEQAQKVVAREVKKRQETADIYHKAGETERAQAELSEKKILEAYLPEQVSEQEITAAIEEVIKSTGAASSAEMGKVIGAVRQKFGASADGAMIARIVKEKLQ